jgi:hypothetical protein
MMGAEMEADRLKESAMAEPGVVDGGTAESVRARVANVLKAGLERDLTKASDLYLAGHGSHIVNAAFEPGVLAQEDGEMLSGWDDERFEKFAERLSELRNSDLPN